MAVNSACFLKKHVGKALCKHGLGTRDRRGRPGCTFGLGPFATEGAPSLTASLCPVHSFSDRPEVCRHLQSLSDLGGEQTVERKGLRRILQTRLVDPTAEGSLPLPLPGRSPNKTGTANLSRHPFFHRL